MNVMANVIKGVVVNMNHYKGLLKQLIKRDVKLKYRRSVLGYVWSVLNPLLTMIVMTVVFSHFFRFDIKNFPVYLLSGQVIFTFFSTATSRACFSILENGSLIRKIYVPKYIFVFSRVTSAFVDYLFSITALLLVMIITMFFPQKFGGTTFSFWNLLFIIPSLEIYIFSMGIGMFLAQANVFFRDIQYLWGVFCTALSYLTPLFYPITILPSTVRFIVEKFNPLFLYVDMFRQCVYQNQMINPWQILWGFCWAFGAFLIGSLLFKKNQDKFILYI